MSINQSTKRLIQVFCEYAIIDIYIFSNIEIH
jgi:hypothetical protein